MIHDELPRYSFPYFFKNIFDWKQSEFLRMLRNKTEVNNVMLSDKKITVIQQEHWFNNEYRNNNSLKINLIKDNSIDEYIGYFSHNIDLESIANKRIRFNYIIDNSFEIKLIDKKRIIKRIIDNTYKCEVDIKKVWIILLKHDREKIEFLTKKFNFNVDCTIPEHIFKNGKFYDILILSLRIP